MILEEVHKYLLLIIIALNLIDNIYIYITNKMDQILKFKHNKDCPKVLLDVLTLQLISLLFKAGDFK